MFRLICIKLIQKTNVHNRVGYSANTVHLLHLQTQSLQSNSITETQHSPTVPHLIQKFGVPLDSAISPSSNINTKIAEKADSFLEFFKDYAFTETQFKKLISNYRLSVLADPLKTLKPKFEFFESSGLSKPDIVKIVSLNSSILNRSLKTQIIPFINLLKRFIHNNDDLVTALSRWRYIRFGNFEANILVLQHRGVPNEYIGKLMMLGPRALVLEKDRLMEIVSTVEKLKLDPCSRSFVLAIAVMGSMGKSCWEKKIEAYKSFGWSQEDVSLAFKYQPHCMLISEKKIREMMNFYINEMGLKASYVVKYPTIVMFSIEKRLIPRCSVLQVLVSNGLISNNLNIAIILMQSKNIFEKKYVQKYQKEAPDVLKAYQGELGYPKLETLRAILRCDDQLLENPQGIGN